MGVLVDFYISLGVQVLGSRELCLSLRLQKGLLLSDWGFWEFGFRVS